MLSHKNPVFGFDNDHPGNIATFISLCGTIKRVIQILELTATLYEDMLK